VSQLASALGTLQLASPWWLAALAVLPLGQLLRRRRRCDALRFGPAALYANAAQPSPPAPSLAVRLLGLPTLLRAAALACAILALARPVQLEPLPLEKQGIDILLCIDRSSSMLAEDLGPGETRMQLARAAAARFVEGRESDRIGLIGFARFPDLVCPPTLQHATLLELCAQLESVESDGPEDRTGVGLAVARAAQVFEHSDASSRVVVLLTDGEENVAQEGGANSISPAQAGALCARAGVRVYTIAVGQGRRTSAGAWVAPDTRAVSALARDTGGAFFEARDADSLRAVWARIDALETSPFHERRYTRLERFMPLLLAALALLGLAYLAEATVLECLS